MGEKAEVVKLTCAEISSLWGTFLNDSMVICVITHFLETVEDSEVKQMLEETLQIAKNHKDTIEDIFLNEKIVVPQGFPIEKHVTPNAPRLFSDIFYLQFVLQLARFGVTSHTSAITLSAREDICQMYRDFMGHTSQLYQHVVHCMQSKGVFVRMPFMTYPEAVDFVDEKKFLTGWFGRRRALLGMEATHLIMNAINNEIGKATCVGFSQVATDQVVRDYFLRGKHVCTHLLSSIHDVLEESDVPTAMSWDQNVTNSTNTPFSDQLMLYIVGTLSNLGVAAYGVGISASMRRDIVSMYLGFMSKAGAYGEDGMNLMIERNWLEQPPQFEDREKLAKRKN
ncbi:DUF3231 family protein [Cytobacillus massiliigabonensis]|uniref:DUF3231 family protein n=1 Tax=Cytobacillus massiliigabonensis TaxID=1871011 RepID=UPI000C84E6E3|nr:DUF3231 family protein [Cytobacillus massiliigabonensis]